MEKSKNFDTSAVASNSINEIDKIIENTKALVHLMEKRNLTKSVREKDVLLCGIEDKILNLKDILDI